MSDGMSLWSLGRYLQVVLYDYEFQIKMYYLICLLFNWCFENFEMFVLYKYVENGLKLCVVSLLRGVLVLYEVCEFFVDFQYGQKYLQIFESLVLMILDDQR